MVTCEALAIILEDELDMNKETWETWALCYQPPDDHDASPNEERRIDSDVSLRSAIKLLRTAGNIILPLLLRESIGLDSEEEEPTDHSDEEVSEEEGSVNRSDEVSEEEGGAKDHGDDKGSEDEPELKKDSKSE